MQLRHVPAFLVLVAAIAAFAGFAWLTRHPESPFVDRAAEWPVVGGLAARFRDAYRPPPPPPPREPEATAEGEPEPVFLGRRREPPPPDLHRYVWVVPGVAIRSGPEATAPTVAFTSKVASVPVLETDGDWHRVVAGEGEGWVLISTAADRPPFGDDPEPPGPLDPTPADPARLEQARALFGSPAREGTLGPYRLLTDSRDDGLLRWLDKVAAAVEPAYERRYGLAPRGVAVETILLYAHEDDYRRLQGTSPRIVGLTAAGHNAHGMAASYVGGREANDVASTVVHEIVHLLNRRALGPALPPWLDEGLSEDLANVATGVDGGLLVGRLGGEARRSGNRIDYAGALSSLVNLQTAHREGRLPRLPQLLDADWDAFLADAGRRLLYDEAAFFLRYLSEGEGGRRAEAWRSFLAAVARGTPPTAERLEERLGEPLPLLEASFKLWIERAELPSP